MSSKSNEAFWPSYVDIMTTLFAIMLVLFVVSFRHFKNNEEKLLEFKAKYEELESIYKTVENIDTAYFKYDSVHVKHIFKLVVEYQPDKFAINGGLVLDQIDIAKANALRRDIVDAGKEIKETILKLQQNDSVLTQFRYMVVIEGQASAEGNPIDNYILSYKRALYLNEFWKFNGIDIAEMDRCELLISGSGPKGIPRDENDKLNRRFLIHIVPVIGDVKRTTDEVGVGVDR